MSTAPIVSPWQIAATIVTALGVLTALGIAVWSSWERRCGEQRQQLAEARTFRVRGFSPSQEEDPTAHPNDRRITEYTWYAEHLGEHPIFEVHYEAWIGRGVPAEGPPTWVQRAEYLAPGAIARAMARPDPVPDKAPPLTAWRVRWTDRWGNQWSADTPNQVTPDRFTGQAPRPY